MTDMPGLLVLLLCTYLCLRAIVASSDRATVMWLVSAAMSSLVGGTVRQTSWLGALIVVPSTAWYLRRRRGGIGCGIDLGGRQRGWRVRVHAVVCEAAEHLSGLEPATRAFVLCEARGHSALSAGCGSKCRLTCCWCCCQLSRAGCRQCARGGGGPSWAVVATVCLVTAVMGVGRDAPFDRRAADARGR